jgi:hypothetical protein
MWSFLKHYDRAQPGKRKTASATPTNSELTELVPEFTIRPAFPTSVKNVNTSFKNVWRTWGPALPTLLADLMIFCPLGPTNLKNSANARVLISCIRIVVYENVTPDENLGCKIISYLLQMHDMSTLALAEFFNTETGMNLPDIFSLLETNGYQIISLQHVYRQVHRLKVTMARQINIKTCLNK